MKQELQDIGRRLCVLADALPTGPPFQPGDIVRRIGGIYHGSGSIGVVTGPSRLSPDGEVYSTVTWFKPGESPMRKKESRDDWMELVGRP